MDHADTMSLDGLVPEAIHIFNEKEKYLIENDLSERCICARFAMCLSDVLEGTRYRDYCVDVEYNRGALGDTRIAKILDGRKIICDLIVHKRGYDEQRGFDNLICIEMKKSSSRVGTAKDENRLRAMTSLSRGFQYKLGYMIMIDLKNNELHTEHIFTLR